MFNGDVIKTLLLKQGKKASELCEYVFGNSRYSLQHLTKEDANPTAKTIEALADFFRVPVDVFFKRSVDYSVPDENQVNADGYIFALKQTIESKDEIIALLREKVARLESAAGVGVSSVNGTTPEQIPAKRNKTKKKNAL